MIKLRLNNRFYSKKAIEETAKAFDKICSVEIADDEYNLTITPEQEENQETIKKEFANYCLGLMR